ncbi:MAG TPA: acyltransferase [Verrucomicrobiae bacterium]|nr:acyltransferase [Verrucomicrobiae bacterium]
MESGASPTMPERVLTLDVFRGVAAWLVLIHHCLRATPGLNANTTDFWQLHRPAWTAVGMLGSLGVTCFFMISGASFGISLKENFTAVSFFIRRLFRIYPAYLLAILGYFVFGFLYVRLRPFVLDDWMSPQFTTKIEGYAWLTYLSMTFNFFGPSNRFNNVLWTLPVEVQFYLALPLFVFFVRRLGKARGAAATLVLCGLCYILAQKAQLPGKTLSRIWEFGLGFTVGLYGRVFVPLHKVKAAAPAIGTAAMVLLIGPRVHEFALPYLPWNFLDAAAICGLLMVCFMFGPYYPARGEADFGVKLGQRSYSIYLFHNLVIASICLGMYRFAYHWPPAPFFMTLTLAATAATFLLTGPVHRLERKFIQRGRRLTAKTK